MSLYPTHSNSMCWKLGFDSYDPVQQMAQEEAISIADTVIIVGKKGLAGNKGTWGFLKEEDECLLSHSVPP